MSLYQHPLFTIDLNKVIAVYQDNDEPAVTIRTDDQRKVEVATETPEAAVEFLDEFATAWENSVGSLLRHSPPAPFTASRSKTRTFISTSATTVSASPPATPSARSTSWLN